MTTENTRWEGFTSHKSKSIQMPVSFAHIETIDAIQHAESLPLWQQDYAQLSCGRFIGSISSASFGSVQIFRESMNQAVDQRAQPWENSYAIGVPNKLEGEGYWHFKPLVPDCIFGLLPDEELSFRTPRLSDIFVAVIDASIVESYSQQTGAFDTVGFMNRSRVCDCTHATAARLRLHFATVLEQVSENPAILKHSSTLKTLSDGVIDAVILTISELSGPLPGPTGHRIHRSLVNRAKEYVMSRCSNPPSVVELCTYLGMNRRSLHYCFMNVLGINPVTFLRYVRLHGVRQDLLNAESESLLIGEVAMRWGFWHLGMFSSYYKALYGETPSETIKRKPKTHIWQYYAAGIHSSR